MGDPILRFKVDLSYGCSVSYNFNDFKTYCDSANSPVVGLEIFKNRLELTAYGQFGNANIYYTKVSNSLLDQSKTHALFLGLVRNNGSSKFQELGKSHISEQLAAMRDLRGPALQNYLR